VSREYPDSPRVGVGAVVLHEGRVLLVRRGHPPLAGKWSLPGGLCELGETTAECARREVEEECGLGIRVVELAGVLDRVVRDEAGRIRYHWVLVDYLAVPESNQVTAGSDAAEVRWVDIDRVDDLDHTDGLVEMIQRAVTLARGSGA
jgi:8-oxo-dGTP diphosphatase